MRVTIASVLSHLVIRIWCFWKIKEKKIEKEINIDLAIIAGQFLREAVHNTKIVIMMHLSSTLGGSTKRTQ